MPHTPFRVLTARSAARREAARRWLADNSIPIEGEHAILYKAVSHTLLAGESHTPTRYEIGSEVTCPDWIDDDRCGHGLHLSPHPHNAFRHRPGARYTHHYGFEDRYGRVRFLRCRVHIDDIRPICLSKCKVRRLTVLDEVDVKGNPLVADDLEEPA